MLGSVLMILAIVLFIAFLIETLVEFALGTLFDKIPKLALLKWTIMYVAIAVAIFASFLYRLDLVFMLAQFLGTNDIPQTTFGMIITGVAIGKGSNYLHDLFKKFFVKSDSTG